MKAAVVISLLCVFYVPAISYAQTNKRAREINSTDPKAIQLLSELQLLERDTKKMDSKIDRAFLITEIADAAGSLDKAWSYKLLREAFALTLPDEPRDMNDDPIGAPLTLGSKEDIARSMVRHRIISIAAQDKALADELIALSAERLGRQASHYNYTTLAEQALAGNDMQTANDYLQRAFAADPSLVNAAVTIFDVAVRDRAAADKLITQYIAQLRRTPVQTRDGLIRAFSVLDNLIFNPQQSYFLFGKRDGDLQYSSVAAPGVEIIRTYITFVFETVSLAGQREPGAARRWRNLLLSVYQPINKYAPDMLGDFAALERLSRTQGGDNSLPQRTTTELRNASYEDRVRRVMDSRTPDELTIQFAISKGDYERARKMIGMLDSADPLRATLTETVNMREAMTLAARGERSQAIRLARELRRASSIAPVFARLLSECQARTTPQTESASPLQAQICAQELALDAAKQLKNADDRNFIAIGFARLAMATADADKMLALELLDESVAAANSNELDLTMLLQHDFAKVFEQLYALDNVRVRQAATSLKSRLPRLAARAAIYRHEARDLENARRTSN